MSVLIKGMGFPTKENFMTQLYLICDKDGNWYAVDATNKDLYKLIEVKEPHGRLGDLDVLQEQIKLSVQDAHMSILWKQGMAYAHGLVEASKTVIEAERREKE